jgi:hypothetical protein
LDTALQQGGNMQFCVAVLIAMLVITTYGAYRITRIFLDNNSMPPMLILIWICVGACWYGLWKIINFDDTDDSK